MQVDIITRRNRDSGEEQYQVALTGAGERLTSKPTTLTLAFDAARHLCHNLGLGWFTGPNKSVVKLGD